MNKENKSFTPIHDAQHDERKSVLFFLMAVAALLVVAAALVTWIQISSDEFEEANQASIVKVTVAPTGSYKPFSASAVQTALTSGDKVILFFTAPWCPLCRATEDNLMSSMKNIPESVSIFTINYDTASELKQKYDVRSEHTFVQLDSSGGVVTKWVGTQTLPDILTKLK